MEMGHLPFGKGVGYDTLSNGRSDEAIKWLYIYTLRNRVFSPESSDQRSFLRYSLHQLQIYICRMVPSTFRNSAGTFQLGGEFLSSIVLYIQQFLQMCITDLLHRFYPQDSASNTTSAF